MGLVLRKHPEIITGGLFKLSPETLYGPNRANFVGKPGAPRITPKKNMPFSDWEAWFLYYELCQFWGFAVTLQDIADLTGKTFDTVKQKFHRVRREILNINT